MHVQSCFFCQSKAIAFMPFSLMSPSTLVKLPFELKGTTLRWPTTVTSNTNCSHQIQIAHIKYKLFTSNTNCSHQIQIAHIKYKSLTSNTILNGQRSENENYVQFSLGLDPTAILFLHMVLSSGCFAATAEEMSTIVTFVATAGKVS